MVIMTDIPHPSEFLSEELEARGWTLSDLANRMGMRRCVHHKLVLDMYFLIGPEKTNCRIGAKTAFTIAEALNINPQFLINLENAWLRSKGVEV